MSDEPVIVVDMGSASVKAGYSGDDVPASIFPSAVQKWATGIDAIEANNDTLSDSTHPIYRGEVKDWDQLEKLWRITLDEIGLASPESASVMLTESPRSTFDDRKKWAELLFETFRVPSLCIGNSAPLSLFASGRTTGIVVECGAGITSSVPVFEGLALTHASITMDYGGQDISLNLQRLLQEHQILIEFADARVLKERMAVVSVIPISNYNPFEDIRTFSLPDGTEVSLDKRIFSDCTEPLCCKRYNNDSQAMPMSNLAWGLTDQVYESLRLCDDSARKDLAHSVILAGGTSMLPGLGDRLEADLKYKFKDSDYKSLPNFDVRVIPHSSYREPGYTSQRRIAAWIGGSILSSLSTYKQIKITRQEWEESPESCIQTKSI